MARHQAGRGAGLPDRDEEDDRSGERLSGRVAFLVWLASAAVGWLVTIGVVALVRALWQGGL
jgi:hypothetical protein